MARWSSRIERDNNVYYTESWGPVHILPWYMRVLLKFKYGSMMLLACLAWRIANGRFREIGGKTRWQGPVLLSEPTGLQLAPYD